LGEIAARTIPEIQELVRIRPMKEDEGVVVTSDNDKTFLEYDLYYVDKHFLRMFNYPLKSGDVQVALRDLNSIVITEKVATKYFGEKDPMGKVLHVKGGSLSGEFVVSGVLEDLPRNTHLQFDFLLPLEFMLSNYGIYTRDEGWSWFNFYTYITLDKYSEPSVVQGKIGDVIQSNINQISHDEELQIEVGLQQITDIHLHSAFESDLAVNPGSDEDILFYSIIVLIILVIAYVNFINLTTVQALKREKEIGIRKSIGVYKSQIVTQFFSESLVINLVAAVLGVALAFLFLPFLSEVMGMELELNLLHSALFLLLFSALIIAGTFLSAIYPALVLSSFRPINIFSSYTKRFGGNITMRKVLVGLQFSLTILLVAGSYVVFKQIQYMKNKDLGVDLEKIIIVPGPRVILEEGSDRLEAKYQTFKLSIQDHHAIKSVTGTSNVPGKGVMWYGNMRKLGLPQEFAKEGKAVLVDADFTDTYDFEFLAGSGFSSEMEEYSKVIINEMAVSAYQLGSPLDAIGQSIILSGIDTLEIQGVTKDIHWSSLKEPLSPTVFGIARHNAYFSISTTLRDIPNTINHIESAYRSSFPNDPFEYYFLDNLFGRQYQSDVQFGKLFTVFTVLAIFLASIGLFTLVSYASSLRIKEISLRKLFGASVSDIVKLLSKEYLILMVISALVVTPVALFGANLWLEGFAFRINLGLDFFVLPMLLLIVVSAITIGYRIYISATNNPSESLKA